MLRSHKIRLEPTDAQAFTFARVAGFHRMARNWAVGAFRDALTVGDWVTPFELNKRFTVVKHTLYPWHTDLPQSVAKWAIVDGAGSAIKRYGAYRKQVKDGHRPSQKVGKPKFWPKNHRKAFTASNGRATIRVEDKCIMLPAKMGGAIKMSENLRLNGVIQRVVISKRAKHWYASILVDDGLPLPDVADNGKPTIGVDLGVKELAVCSDGVRYQAPKPLRYYLKKLRRLNKSLSRKVKGSANWHKQVAAIQRLHARIADIRNDAIHKATSAIVARAGEVKAEDLHIAGMMRNRRLARAIADTGMGEFLRQLEYKCAWAGIRFSKVSRWFPSSKLCYHCGWKNDTLKLAQREWWCGGCGALIDRDFGASVNIEHYEPPGGTGRQPVETRIRPAIVRAAVSEAGTPSVVGQPVNSQLRLW